MTDRANPNPASPSPASADLRDGHLQERGGVHRQVPLEPRRARARSSSSIPARPTERSRSFEDFSRRGFPIRLIHQPWLGYAAQKQFALDQAREPWILSIDADEWLDDDLRAALPRLLAADPSLAGWKLAPDADALRTARASQPLDAARSISSGWSGADAPTSTPTCSFTKASSPTARPSRPQGASPPRARPAARRADEEGDRLRPAQGGATARARQEAVAAQAAVQPADLLPAHLLLEPLFPVRLGGLHPCGDRRDLFAHDGGHAPPILLRPESVRERAPMRTRAARAGRHERQARGRGAR